jgi:hypothetical protein
LQHPLRPSLDFPYLPLHRLVLPQPRPIHCWRDGTPLLSCPSLALRAQKGPGVRLELTDNSQR